MDMAGSPVKSWLPSAPMAVPAGLRAKDGQKIKGQLELSVKEGTLFIQGTA